MNWNKLHPAILTLSFTHTNKIHIWCFKFDALAQGNAYKPTEEPINYRGPGGDRTHDLQTEATPPAASCPACSLHVTEIVLKNNSNDMPEAPLDNWQIVWNAQVSIATPGCVNFELCPGAGCPLVSRRSWGLKLLPFFPNQCHDINYHLYIMQIYELK